jgi:hypothetical protein
MTFQDFLIDAIDVVLTWFPDETLADESFGEIVKSQACLMSRSHLD